MLEPTLVLSKIRFNQPVAQSGQGVRGRLKSGDEEDGSLGCYDLLCEALVRLVVRVFCHGVLQLAEPRHEVRFAPAILLSFLSIQVVNSRVQRPVHILWFINNLRDDVKLRLDPT